MPVDPRPAPPEIPLTTSSSSFARRHRTYAAVSCASVRRSMPIVAPHEMPDAASTALSEALALAALCGSALPAGRQSQSADALGRRRFNSRRRLCGERAASRLCALRRSQACRTRAAEERGQTMAAVFSATGISPSRSILDLEKSATKACLRSRTRRLRPRPPHTSSSAKHCRRSFGWPSRALHRLTSGRVRQNNGGTGVPGV